MPMGEVVTLLTSASGHSLVKSFTGQELSPQPFSTGKLFTVSEEPVSDLKSLSALLQRLEDDPTHTIIRGSLVDGQSSQVPRNKKYFTVTPRQWCMAANISLVRRTAPGWPSTSEPLMIVFVGSFSSLCKTFDRLLRSDTGSSDTLNSLPVEKGCGDNSWPVKLLTRECPEADVRSVTTSPICIPFQTWSEKLNMEAEKYQHVMISKRD